MGIGPGEGNAHPQPDEDTKQLDDVSVSDGVEPTENRVEDSHARAEDYRCAVVHVDDYHQCRT